MAHTIRIIQSYVERFGVLIVPQIAYIYIYIIYILHISHTLQVQVTFLGMLAVFPSVGFWRESSKRAYVFHVFKY